MADKSRCQAVTIQLEMLGEVAEPRRSARKAAAFVDAALRLWSPRFPLEAQN